MALIEKVIESGNCVGCGACAFAVPSQFQMTMTGDGHWQAQIDRQGASEDLSRLATTVCPMSGEGADETTIAAELYPDIPEDGQIGRYIRNIAGYVTEGNYRAAGSSGGLVSWMLAELLRRGEVDAILHVQPADSARDKDLLFEFAITRSQDEIARGAKSRYYPIQFADLLRTIVQSDLRYVVVGVPCFIKAIRLLQRESLLDRGKVPYCVGLVCGHLKSRYFAEYLAWQKGAKPGSLVAFDFRRKLLDRPASDYGFSMTFPKEGALVEETHPMASVKGRDWGIGLFKNPACEFCDDVLAECADIAVGDAWLPQYVGEPLGTNVAVVRHPQLDVILREGAARGAIAVQEVGVADIIKSQSSGLRHRREGLAHRLARRIEAGSWAPRKRVEPRLAATAERRQIYDLRLQIAEVSSPLFAAARADGDLMQFEVAIAPLISRYQKLGKPSIPRRIVWKIKTMLKRWRE